MADRIQQRRDTKARWEEFNPVLLEGEVGYVTDDPNRYKIGDGINAWNDLPYRGFDGTIVQETGNSESAVMSQKATTEKLTELESEVNDNTINIVIGDYSRFLQDRYTWLDGGTKAIDGNSLGIFADIYISKISAITMNEKYQFELLWRKKEDKSYVRRTYWKNGSYTISEDDLSLYDIVRVRYRLADGSYPSYQDAIYDMNLILEERVFSRIEEKLETKQNKTDCPYAVSRATISIDDSSVTIGDGYIYIYIGGKEYMLNHTETTYSLSNNSALVFDIPTRLFSIVQRTEIDTLSTLPLFIYDGVKGICGGLLFGRTMIDRLESKVNPLNNFTIAPRVTITASGNTISISSGYLYLTGSIQRTISITEASYTLASNEYLILRNYALTTCLSSERLSTDIVLLIYDGVKGFCGGELYPYLKVSQLEDNIKSVSNNTEVVTQASPQDSLMITLHGAIYSLPQNCKPLYQKAGKNGILHWECDVRPCADDYVLSHDDDLYQLALDADGNVINEGEWKCSERTIAELKTLKTGIVKGTSSILSGYESATIITFREFLSLCKRYGAVAVVEIKFAATQQQCEDLYNLAMQMGMQHRVLWLLYANQTNHATYLTEIDADVNLIYCGEYLTIDIVKEVAQYKTSNNIVGVDYYASQFTDEIITECGKNKLIMGMWGSAADTASLSTYIDKGLTLLTINTLVNPITQLRDL